MKNDQLPSLRALHIFDVFGRTNSVAETARELRVTPGAVSQQLKFLEEQTGHLLLNRSGRGVMLRPEAEIYHRYVSRGFESLYRAQQVLRGFETDPVLSISALPSLLSKWLNPALGTFQDAHPGISLRLDSTHQEADRYLQTTRFRITYGEVAQRYPYSRELFTDTMFPVCSAQFLRDNPEIVVPTALQEMPLLSSDWGYGYQDIPDWDDWFRANNIETSQINRAGIFSLSSLTLEAAIEGKGVALAQTSFASRDLELGRLVRLSSAELLLPKPYFICWGEGAMQDPVSKDFLNWITKRGRDFIGQLSPENTLKYK